jgi:hypothetical protein
MSERGPEHFEAAYFADRADRKDVLPLSDTVVRRLDQWAENPDPLDWISPIFSVNLRLLISVMPAEEATQQLGAETVMLPAVLSFDTANERSKYAMERVLKRHESAFIDDALGAPRPHFMKLLGEGVVVGCAYETAEEHRKVIKVPHAIAYGVGEEREQLDFPELYQRMSDGLHHDSPEILLKLGKKFAPDSVPAVYNLFETAYETYATLDRRFRSQELEDQFRLNM